MLLLNGTEAASTVNEKSGEKKGWLGEMSFIHVKMASFFSNLGVN